MAKIINAEIKFIFKDNADPKAIYKVTYDDESTESGDGIQGYKHAQELMKELTTETIE